MLYEVITSKHYRKDVPVWVEAALQKALQPNPEFRYDTFSEFMQDLSTPNRTLESNFQQRPVIRNNFV